MAITINWLTKVISVPKADMTLIQTDPFEVRELNLDWFRLQLKNLEDSEAGILYPDTHRHNTEIEVGGVLLAPVIEMINGYTITFEDGQYAVNLVGANSNVSDVVNLNQVSIRASNSAGLTSDPGLGFFSQTVEPGINFLQSQKLQLAALAGLLSGADGTTVTIKNAKAGGGTKDRIVATVDEFGNRSEVIFDLSD